MTRPIAFPAVLLLLSAACATAPVNMEEPRRVVGTESAVRVDAEIRGDELRAGAPLQITYAITNQRPNTIAIADILPVSTFDSETLTVTVNVGAEVPGETTLPRLISIGPGETKTFTTAARVAFVAQSRSADPRARLPAALRLKVNFLGDTEPFADLLNIPERIVADKKRADELFPVWLERNEVVYTNAVPMRWVGRDTMEPRPTPPPSRRGRPGVPFRSF